MSRAQKIIIAVLSIITVLLLSAIGISAYQTYAAYAAEPLGPRLPVFTPLSLPPTWTPDPEQVTQLGKVTLVPTIPFVTNTVQPFCGGQSVMNILVVGADSRQDSYTYGLGDAIRLVRVDFVTPKVTVLEFPRDLWVEIPHIADDLNGQDHEKLNQAYLYGQPGFKYWDDPSGGPGLLALTLNQNFGARVDQYAAINMRTFVNIVNAVDGIDITMTDKDTAKKLDLMVGENHLNGDQALRVARNRSEGTFGRAGNQNMVLCALRKKLTQPAVVTQIPDLIASFRDNILTDLSPSQLAQLACLGTRLPPRNILFASFPQELFTQTRVLDPVFDKRVFIWDVDFEILKDYVDQFQAGTWPVPLPAANPTDEPEVTCQ